MGKKTRMGSQMKKKQQIVTQTWIFPDNMPEAQQLALFQADLNRMHEEQEREEWFQKEAERRGLTGRGFLSSLFGF